LTCIETYHVADFFDIDSLRSEMLARIASLAERVLSLQGHSRKPLWHRADTEEKRHMRSFLEAAIAVERHPWRPRLQSSLYAAGERIRERLVELPDFQLFIEDDIGQKFARAIGLDPNCLRQDVKSVALPRGD